MADRKIDTDQRIMDKAISMINEHGEESLSLRKLAQGIGLTTGAFYTHFSTKEELLQAVTVLLSRQEQSRMAKKLQTVREPEEQLLTVASILLRQFKDEPNLMHFLFFNPIARNVLKVDRGEFAFYDQMMQMVEAVIQKRHLSVQPKDLFIQLWAFIQGYGLLLDSDVTEYDAVLVRETLLRLLEA